MDIKTFVPMYIRQVLDSKPRETITADRWNELWNLAITQGDHNAEIAAILCAELVDTQHTLNTQLPIIESNTLFQQSHPNSSDHDVRYYTKAQLDPMLRSGDTLIKEEVFIIVNSNLGDGTFTYQNADGVVRTGTLDGEGYQIFALEQGNYALHENRIHAIVGDTLRRSVKSGGLKEVDTTHVALSPEGNGAEITFNYFEKIGLAGEHGVTHSVGQGDELPGLLYVGVNPPENGLAFWCEVVEE